MSVRVSREGFDENGDQGLLAETTMNPVDGLSVDAHPYVTTYQLCELRWRYTADVGQAALKGRCVEILTVEELSR